MYRRMTAISTKFRIDASTEVKTYYTSTGGAAFTKAISDTGTYIELAVST